MHQANLRNRVRSSLLLAFGMWSGVLGAGCGSDSGGGGTSSEQLVGRWTSAGCEAYPNGSGDSVFLKRDTSFTAGEVTVISTLFNEAGCATQFATSTLSARYTLKMPSAVVPGATEIDYTITGRTITPLTNNAVSALSSGVGGKCGSSPWTLNQPGDVSQTGCPVLGTLSLSACPTELDIVQVDSGKLLSGDRAGVNVCTSRPTKLGALYVTKVQ